jgi:Polyketide cyclase / dehydrase and lipid transport
VSGAQIAGEIIIQRSAAEVFDFVADERNEPSYNPQLVAAEKLTSGPVGAGTRYRAEARTKGGRTALMTIEITGYDRPRRLESSTTLAMMDIHGTLTFQPVDHGTRMRWSWQVWPRGLLRLATPAIAWQGRRQEQAIWASLKRYLEAPRPHPDRYL